jgi:RNA polymerase sigma factor (sigma-70 family)
MLGRDETIVETLWVAKTLARRYAEAYDYLDYQDMYDLCEELIITLYDKWERQGKFSTFVWKCCEKRIWNYKAKKERRLNIDTSKSLDDIAEVPSTENVYETVEAKMLLQSMIAYAAVLNGVQKRILGAILQGYQGAEVGKVLKLPKQTFYRNKAEAITALKKAVGY